MKKRQADFVRKYMRELRHALPINYPNQKKILHSIKQNLINYINENPYSDYSNPVSYTHLDVYKRQLVDAAHFDAVFCKFFL